MVCVLSLEKVVAQDAKIVIGNVGEGGATLDVADAVDAGNVGFQAGVDAQETPVVGRDSSGGEIEVVGVRGATDSDEQMCSLDGLRLIAGLHLQRNFVFVSADALSFCVEKNVDAIFAEDFCHLVDDVGIFMRE